MKKTWGNVESDYQRRMDLIPNLVNTVKGYANFEKETLTPSQKVNEYILTSLRTREGLDLNNISETTGNELRITSRKFIESGKLILKENKLLLTKEGKLFADGIAAELFVDH